MLENLQEAETRRTTRTQKIEKKKERKGEEKNKEREKDRERKKVIVEIVPALLQLQKFPWKLLGSFPCPLAAREHGNKRFRGRVQRSRRRRAS